MNKIKKLLCMLLVCAMVATPCGFFSMASEQSEEAEPITIEITTDKSNYSSIDIANITVIVTNTSEETINNISAEAVMNDLAPINKKTSVTFYEVESLQPGDSFNFSYRATLNANKVGVGFFEKVLLWFVRLFNGGYNATSQNIEAVTENITEIKFGKYTVQNVVRVEYDLSQDVLSTETVVSTLNILMSSNEYQNKNQSEKIQAVKSALSELEKNNLIVSNSINYNSNTQSFHFILTSGAMVGLLIEEEKEYLEPWLSPIGITNTTEYTVQQSQFFSKTTTQSNNNNDEINSIIMYGFDKPSKKDRSLNDWKELCIENSKLNTKILDCPTVQKFKTALLNQDFITIFEHGDYGSFVDNTYVFVVQNEAVTPKSLLLYASDIYAGRVVLCIQSNGTIQYGITPSFFEYYYKNKLTDSIVFVMSCQGFGGDNVVDYKIADILIEKCGATAVLGFDESVSQAYAYFIYDEIADYLLRGFTIGDAYKHTINKLGKTDRDFLLEYSKTIDDPTERQKWIDAANDPTPARLLLHDHNNGTSTLISPSITNGLVVESNGGSNKPLANVTVTAENSEYKTTGKTNADGKFSLKLPFGTYKISLSLDKYTSIPTTITVDENTATQAPYIFFMKKDSSSGDNADSEKASVHGTVIDSKSKQSISDVKVTLSADDTQKTYTTLTDATGAFSFENLPAGKYTLSFEHEDYTVNGTHSVTLTNGLMFVFTDSFEFEKKDSSGGNTGDDSGDTGNDSGDNYEPIDPNRTVIDSGDCGANGDNVKWVLYDDGELVISGKGAMADYFFDVEGLISILTGINKDTIVVPPYYSYVNQITKVSIYNQVSHIGDLAFCGFTQLESVKFSNYVTSIGAATFCNCAKLISITLPDNVTSIGAAAFSSCANLVSIKLSNCIATIPRYAFSYCSSLTDITLPNGIANIGYSAFNHCPSLTKITIPDTTTTIENDAFSYCSNLRNVYYKGEQTQWDSIIIKSGNINLKHATIHYNS